VRGTHGLLGPDPRALAGNRPSGWSDPKAAPYPVAGTPDPVQCNMVWYGCVPHRPPSNTKQETYKEKERIHKGKCKYQTIKIIVHDGPLGHLTVTDNNVLGHPMPMVQEQSRKR
jgi:hypothetical protein